MEHIAGRVTLDAWTKQRPVRDKHAAFLETLPPSLGCEFVAAVNIDTIRADGVVVRARSAARGRRDTEAAVEDMVVNRFGPAAVAGTTWILRLVARATLAFVIDDAISKRLPVDKG